MMHNAPTMEKAKDDQWFREYVAKALSMPIPQLPDKFQRIGNTQVTWFETEPGIAFIHPKGGSPHDQVLAMLVVRAQLQSHGIRQAQFTLDPDESFRKTAQWDDVMAKAKRLIQSNQVIMKENSRDLVTSHVIGDHGEYDVVIHRQDPNSGSITMWECGCPWDQFAWQRTRQWKKYEGRVCSHVLATYWKSLATPLSDDDLIIRRVPPGGGQPGAPAAPSPFGAPSPGGMPAPAAPAGGVPAVLPENQQLALAEQPFIPQGYPQQPTRPVAPPTGYTPQVYQPGTIPPFPLDAIQQAQQAINPASVPGLRQPSPTNPVQYPGGTYSSISEWNFGTTTHLAAEENFQNGSIVATKNEDWGEWVGKSREHGAGSPAKIPANSIGEVMGQDPTTGMVQVLFMGELTKEHGPLMPYGAVAWFFPSELVIRSDVRRPGPAIRRRRENP